MLKKIKTPSKMYILNIFNKLWVDGYFPIQWQHSIVITIPKPGKNHSQSDNYRPIALTSCRCKLMERMINNRLIKYFEMHKVITNTRCGCWRGRSTVENLVGLESVIRVAFINSEHFVSVFFDLEKAYDQTWRHGIVMEGKWPNGQPP